MERLRVDTARAAESIDKQVLIQGWVRTRRDSKAGFSFLEVNDGSSMAGLQVIADAELPNYATEVKRLSAGCSVSIEGRIVASTGKGQETELQASKLTVHGWADPETYPLQKKRHSFEKLREWAHLRPRTNTFGAVSRVRNCISQTIHDFFQSRHFLYITTPIITTSDCEGAGEMFQVTTLDLANLPQRNGGIDFDLDFFDRPAYLTVSGQLEAETYATALGNVYTFGPTFRAENSNTSRHLAEFWMVEPEMAFCDLDQNMTVAEELLKWICIQLLFRCESDLDFFNSRIDDQVIDRLKTTTEQKSFNRISYTEAIELLNKSGQEFEFPANWGNDLQAEHERFLTDIHFKAPVIVHDYPKTIKPFYMKLNDDERTVRAMDFLVPQVGEIVGGSQREDRADVLEQRMREQGLDPEAYWWYLDLRRYGSVPHAGFGLGLERVVQFATGMANVRDVIPFPRTPGNADF